MQTGHSAVIDPTAQPSIAPTLAYDKLTRAERKLAFWDARRNGVSISKAARFTGVSRTSATKWEKERLLISEQALIRDKERADSILRKEEVAAKLSADLADESTPVQYRASIAAQLSKIQGYEPKRQEDDPNKPREPLKALAINWYNEAAVSLNRPPTAEPIAPQPAPTKALIEGDITPLIGHSIEPAIEGAGSPQASGVGVVQGNSPAATNFQKSIRGCCGCQCHAAETVIDPSMYLGDGI